MSYIDCELETDFLDTEGEDGNLANGAQKSTDRPRVLVADPTVSRVAH